METRPNLQRENLRRGFSISHQKVVLEIDFQGALWGYTEITIIPTNAELKTIHLHSRQCTIQSVTVSSFEAEFTHQDPLVNISFANAEQAQDCHRHPELKRKVYSALQECDEGELSIAIPREVSVKQSGQTEFGFLVNGTATPEPATPGISQSQGPQLFQEFNPIVVKITYSLFNPVDGFQFVIPDEAHAHRVPHAYTTPSSPDAARCWVPCIDNLWERCTWEFEFVVLRYLEEVDELQEETPSDLSPTLVVCSGDLVEQVAHPYSSHKTIFLFSQTVPTSVQHIAFAAGPFHLYTIPLDHLADDASQPPLMYGFCLPGHEALLTTSTSTLRSAMTFYTTEFGSYPFGSYKVVFVDEMPTQRFDSSTLSLVTVDLLHGEDAIEQAVETRHVLSHALACQWIGINILPKTWSDLWLSNGLALYITSLFLRKLFGNNEYRFRLNKDMQRVVDLDGGGMPPICQPLNHDPPDINTIPFINLKAPLVLHILDRRLGKSGTSLGLSRVLPKVFLSAISGEMPNNAIATHSFLRTCRKVSGVDLRIFAEQWIYGSGCPSFAVAAQFNRKKMAVEITMRQESPAWKAHEGNTVTRALFKPVQLFEGQMTIRIHEADGTPYEHVLDIHSPFKRYEVPFNTKYKRVRRNTKRYIARQAAAQAAADGDAEAAEAMGMVDMGFGLDIWEKEQERENWKVSDWTEEDESVMNGATYEWIRMDADFEWISNLRFEQPDFMWVSQLQRDRDVVAQLEAISALALQPTAIVSSTLTKTVLVSNYHYRIRCEAASALVQCAIRRLDFLGLFHLFKLFLRYCYDPEDPNQDLFSHTYVPKPNDFSDLSEYFVRKALLAAISRVRFENGKSPGVVRRFLIDQLRYNDNTANPYSDAFYLCSIISATACATISTAPPERGELLPSEAPTEQNPEDQNLLAQSLTEIDRYRSMDRLIPSPHNIVTIAALEFYLSLIVANVIPNQPKIFFPLTRVGSYTPVRIAAFDGLFLSKWYAPAMMQYILSVMANDSSRVIRRHVARNACYSLALLVQMGEMKNNPKDSEALLIEEDGSRPEQAKELKRSEMDAMIKVLRKDREVGKNEVLRKFLMSIALAPDVDHEVRLCVLKLADMLFRPVEETVPSAASVRIHIPITPVTEVPPPLPKVSVKPPIRLKSSTQVPPSPLVANQTPPKLKLLPSTTEAEARVRPSSRAPESPITRSAPVFKKPKGRPPNPNKLNQPSKAQAAGMGIADLKSCRSALKKLTTNKHARFFQQPVDPIRDQAPNYFQVITKPMDLSTMGAKLEAGKYQDRSQFKDDFLLMISNAKLYNPVNSFVHTEAITFEIFFEKLWNVINKTIEASENSKRAPKVLPPVPNPTFSPPPSSTPPSRPMIKLKMGSQSQGKPEAANPKLLPKAKGRPKAVTSAPIDAPPPPYVDDGSHDLLQEVLAIEREKDEEKSRHRSVVEKDPPTANGAPKRKKHNLSDDEDIIAIAKPPKKERPSSPVASSSKPPATFIPKLTLSTKPRKERPLQPVPGSFKGKERESVSSSVAPKPINNRTNVFSEKKCKEILKNLQKNPDANIFLRPVDPIRDSCPTYFDEIDNPMDLGTVGKKLAKNLYPTMAHFKHDIDLIFSNCRKFNPFGTFPYVAADKVDLAFQKEWTAKVVDPKLSPGEKRSLVAVLNAIAKEPAFMIFAQPVDPVALGIPDYFRVIKPENARDLGTIRTKLEADKYETVDDFETDVDLMADNAVKFNGATSDVGIAAIDIRDKIRQMVNAKLRAPSKKRKEGVSAVAHPAKKMKLG
ncbi:hypothetical protein C8J56DRAFT_316264 [Mycena floridula]|nr:hypothetical protein C8J56DRAFT_316264 [Mycena floridula]